MVMHNLINVFTPYSHIDATWNTALLFDLECAMVCEHFYTLHMLVDVIDLVREWM